jgi:hypothetical protein
MLIPTVPIMIVFVFGCSFTDDDDDDDDDDLFEMLLKWDWEIEETGLDDEEKFLALILIVPQ